MVSNDLGWSLKNKLNDLSLVNIWLNKYGKENNKFRSIVNFNRNNICIRIQQNFKIKIVILEFLLCNYKGKCIINVQYKFYDII